MSDQTERQSRVWSAIARLVAGPYGLLLAFVWGFAEALSWFIVAEMALILFAAAVPRRVIVGVTTRAVISGSMLVPIQLSLGNLSTELLFAHSGQDRHGGRMPERREQEQDPHPDEHRSNPRARGECHRGNQRDDSEHHHVEQHRDHAGYLASAFGVVINLAQVPHAGPEDQLAIDQHQDRSKEQDHQVKRVTHRRSPPAAASKRQHSPLLQPAVAGTPVFHTRWTPGK